MRTIIMKLPHKKYGKEIFYSLGRLKQKSKDILDTIVHYSLVVGDEFEINQLISFGLDSGIIKDVPNKKRKCSIRSFLRNLNREKEATEIVRHNGVTPTYKILSNNFVFKEGYKLNTKPRKRKGVPTIYPKSYRTFKEHQVLRDFLRKRFEEGNPEIQTHNVKKYMDENIEWELTKERHYTMLWSLATRHGLLERKFEYGKEFARKQVYKILNPYYDIYRLDYSEHRVKNYKEYICPATDGEFGKTIERLEKCDDCNIWEECSEAYSQSESKEKQVPKKEIQMKKHTLTLNDIESMDQIDVGFIGHAIVTKIILLTNELTELREKNEWMKTELESKKVADTLEYKALQKEVNELKIRNSRGSEELKAKKRDVERLNKRIQELNEKNSDLERENKYLEKKQTRDFSNKTFKLKDVATFINPKGKESHL